MHTHKHNDRTHTLSNALRGFMIMAGVAMVTATSINPQGTVMQSYILRGSNTDTSLKQTPSTKEPRSTVRLTSTERRRQRALERMTKAIVAESTTDIAPVEPLRPSAPSTPQVATIETANEVFSTVVPPVTMIPNWGDMRTPAEWNRTYKEMTERDFVPIPSYDLERLTTPIKTILTKRDDPESIALITEKLFYSTRHFGAYDIDATEFSAVHPGIDLKLPNGTPIAALADGTVQTVATKEETLGLHVIIEHVSKEGRYYYSIYGHLGSTPLTEGQRISAGSLVGLVGMTGNTSGAHLHLQIDTTSTRQEKHVPYWPTSLPSPKEAAKHTVHPMEFIHQH